MANRVLDNKDDALQWWGERVERERYVVPRADQPTGPGRRILLSGGHAVEVAGGQAWVLKTPHRAADRELCLRNYWRIVEAVLANYEPAVVERESAVRLDLGEGTPPRRLRVRHASNRSRYTIEVCEGLEAKIVAGDVDPGGVRRVEVDGAEIAVDRPERTLLALPLDIVRDHLREISVWLSSLVISRPALREEWERTSRPLLIRRFAEMARDAGNDRLARQLDDFLAAEHGQHISRARTGVGTEVVVPATVPRARSGSPWLARHAVRFAGLADRMSEVVAEEAVDLGRFGRAEIIEQATEAKAWDAYHSTTIEGYRITPEEVSALLGGQVLDDSDPEEVQARMAVRGYSVAFDRCMELLRASDGPVRVTEPLIQDLYVDLFSPSVEAGIVDGVTLRGWRTGPVYVRGSRHVPPSSEKVPQLMSQHVRLVNELDGPALVRAALVHLDFVAIHPFPDGNGRIARFLMNLVLTTAGLPWATIRTDDRQRYFEALEMATVDDDPRPFARFVLEYVSRATEAMDDADPAV